MAFFDYLTITTYDGLKAAVADWLNRADLTDQVPMFIRLAEAQFNRELRVRDMHVRSEAMSDQEFVPLPLDYLQHYSLSLMPTGGVTADLKYISKKTADTYKAQGVFGPTQFYTLTDNAFELIPAPAANLDLVMVYYARIPTLGDLLPVSLFPPPNNFRQLNWLLTKSPDLYLASSILQAAPYLNDQARLQTWAAIRASIMDGMGLENERAMRPETQLIARARAF
jgi:hypothetical protein